MDWQRIVALGIVAITAGLFLWNRFRPRRFSFEKDTHCGCSAAGQGAPASSIVFKARKGQRPEIITRMK